MERISSVERKSTDKSFFRSENECGFDSVSISRLAAFALTRELETYPKPGMVSYHDSGSHSDMDAALFESSIKAIAPFFGRMFDLGKAGADLNSIRFCGIEAEHSMLAATGGVNTHKGAIFVLGLLAAAAGTAKNALAPGELGRIVRERWGAQLLAPVEFSGETAGAEFFRRYAVTGARGEAASGYKHVYDFSLPLLRSLRSEYGFNAAMVQCCFALLTQVADTTLLHRGGLNALALARKLAADFLTVGGVKSSNWLESAEAVHYRFIKENLSAGGVADLLSATIFIDTLEEKL